MSHSINIFKQLAAKYKYTNHIAPEDQIYAIAGSRKNLKKLLKNVGNYGLLFSIVLTVYAVAKKLGIGITFLQCKILVGILSAGICISGIAGGKLIYTYYSKDSSNQIDSNKLNTDKMTEFLELDEQIKEEITIHSKYNIGVNNFQGPDKKLSQSVSNFIAIEMIDLIGPDKVTLLDFKERKKTDKIVMGSIRPLGNKKIITARLVNVENSRAEYVTSEKITSLDELNDACQKISKRIAEKLK